LIQLVPFAGKGNPCLGQFSKKSPVMLDAGEFATVENFRLDELIPRVRWGMARTGTASVLGLNGDFCVGQWAGLLNGVFYLVQAWYINATSNIAIYAGTDPGGNLSEVTSNTGATKYGVTRLSSLYVQVSFAPFKDLRTGKEYLVIQDGVSSPRIWNPAESTSNQKVAINAEVTLPTVGPTHAGVLTFPIYFSVKDAANTSYATGGSGFSGSDTTGSGSSSTANYPTLTITTGVTSPGSGSDYVTVTLGTKDLSGCPQLALLYKTTYADFFEKVKIEIVDSGAGNTTIWDPSASSSIYRMDKINADTDSETFFALFAIDQIAAASRDAVTGLKFSWVGQSDPSATQTFEIYMVAGTGKIRGNALHSFAYLNSGSRSESAAIWLGAEHYQGEYVRNLGARQDLAVRIPNDARCFYQYNINYQNTSTADRDVGVDSLVVYRSDVGESPGLRTYVATSTIASYSGGWSFSSGSAGSLVTYSDNTPVEDKDVSVLAPDLNTGTIPKGIWMLSVNDRLLVLAYDSTGSYNAPAYSSLWASDYGGIRFRRTHKFETDGTRVAFQGEILTCAVQMPTSVFGVNTVLLFSNKAFYRITATSATLINRPERVGSYGTWTPYAVATSSDSVFWLDQLRHVRKYGSGGTTDLSALSVQDELDVIGGNAWAIGSTGNLWAAYGTFFDEKYYISFDRSGTYSHISGREQPLVFDTRVGGWSKDTIGSNSLSTRFWAVFNSQLWVQSKDRYTYQYDRSATLTDGAVLDPATSGTAFSATLKGGFGLPGRDTGMVFHQMHFLIDDVTGGSVAVTANYLPTGTATANASIDGGGTINFCCTDDVDTTAGDGAGTALQVQAVFSANSGIGGMRLYSSEIAVEPLQYNPTRQD